jgi:hypothetical protein
MNDVPCARLLDEWDRLLERRPAFRETLRGYRTVLAAWAEWDAGALAPLGWSAADCRARWSRGTPLLAEAHPPVEPESMEDLVAAVLDLLVGLGQDEDAIRRFARGWDEGDIGPASLFPARGALGSADLPGRFGLSSEAVGFIACASLRPVLERYFADCRHHLTEGVWDLGLCPFCGAPPGFTDIVETGGRRLVCHLCGSGWIFPRLRCPSCGSPDARDFVRYQAEDSEEGYQISACRRCHGYLKELDRRVRWNAGPALVEDWGSPHLDLIARRAGYRRALPTLLEVATPLRAES